MKRRMYWGVAILIILLIGVSVFMLTRTTETEPKIIYNPPTEAEKKQVAQNIQDEIDKEKQNLPPIIAEGDRQEEGTDTEINLEEMTQSHLKTLSKEQLQEIMASFYTRFGLSPPPRGYEYKWADKNVPLLDENGKPVLHKIGDPHINIAIEIGFAPTKEEYEKLNQLKDDLFQAERSGWDDKVVSLTQEIETLEALVQRERPILQNTVWIGKKGTHDRERTRRMADEQLNEALRSYNLEHLIKERRY